MTKTLSESDYDYYITVKLGSGGVLNPRRIPHLRSSTEAQAYADQEQEKRPTDKVYWSRLEG